MSVPAWQVINWTPVKLELPDFQRTFSSFKHLGTTIHADAEQSDLRSGQAVWGMEHDGRWIGVAFEWAEMTNHIVALSDPMQVLSNITLVAADGARVDDGQRIVQLNTAIHELDWQEQIPSRRPLWAERLAA